MDLLYQRYTSPFDYLQQLMDTGNLTQGITYIYTQDNDRKLWELYLHSFPSESFEDWKKKVVGNEKPTKELSQKEVINIAKKSQEILNTFSIN